MLKGRPQHSVGHNPVGALAIVALLILGLITGLTGWLIFEDIGGDWLEEIHEGAASLMLGLVAIHIAGVIISGRIHGEKLVPPMIHGMKQGYPDQAIMSGRPLVAWLLLLVLLGFWMWSFSDSGQILFGDALPAAGDSRSNPVRDDDD